MGIAILEDKTLICRDCGEDFIFAIGEQEFYNEKGFENEPQRCKSCRAKKKATLMDELNLIKNSEHIDKSQFINFPKTTGIHPHTNLNHLSIDEQKIITAFSNIFLISYGGGHIRLANSRYKYSLLKPTEQFKEQFNLEREFVLIFSYYSSFEPRSFDAIGDVHKMFAKISPFRLERICNVIVGKDLKIVEKVKNYLKTVRIDEMQAVIPFSYDEILMNNESINDVDWREFVTRRFRDFLFDKDLFSYQAPLKNELYFFGRQTFVQNLVNRHKSHENSGVFGLRRSGKTSVLFAMQRVLNGIEKNWIWVDGQTLQQMRWNHALRHIVSTAYDKFNIIYHSEKSAYNDLENVNIIFEKDMQELKTKMSGSSLLLMLDEIEWITFGIASVEHWKEGGDYLFFWNAIKAYFHKHKESFNFVVAGTNPKAIESITVNSFDNPLYEQAEIKYMPPFDTTETKDMINQLGGYMGLRFDDFVCAALNEDYGGQPFIIRKFCSKMNEYIKESKLEKPIIINRAIYDKAKKNFDKSDDLLRYFKLILEVLCEKYSNEYEFLESLALGNMKAVDDRLETHSTISHLIGFGIIDVTQGIPSIKNETLKNYLCNENKYQIELKDPEERLAEVHARLSKAERGLQRIIRQVLKNRLGEEIAREELIKALAHSNNKFKNHGYINLSYDELFSNDCIVLLQDLFNIIYKNWEFFKHQIPDRQEFLKIVKDIKDIRDKYAYHPKLMSPIDEKVFGIFRSKMERLEEWIEAFN